MPVASKTCRDGKNCPLNPNFWHPYGRPRSCVMKWNLHSKQFGCCTGLSCFLSVISSASDLDQTYWQLKILPLPESIETKRQRSELFYKGAQLHQATPDHAQKQQPKHHRSIQYLSSLLNFYAYDVPLLCILTDFTMLIKTQIFWQIDIRHAKRFTIINAINIGQGDGNSII